jgi:mannose-6-phosphate isomerase
MHALGAGNVIVEIQENSDTTYRIYDWDRAKKRRAPRPMHITEAMQCVDFTDFTPQLLRPEGESLVRHELFEVDKWTLDKEREVAEHGRFAIVVCLTGEVECGKLRFKPGDFFLAPAQMEDRVVRPVEGNAWLLRVMMP